MYKLHFTPDRYLVFKLINGQPLWTTESVSAVLNAWLGKPFPILIGRYVNLADYLPVDIDGINFFAHSTFSEILKHVKSNPIIRGTLLKPTLRRLEELDFHVEIHKRTLQFYGGRTARSQPFLQWMTRGRLPRRSLRRIPSTDPGTAVPEAPDETPGPAAPSPGAPSEEVSLLEPPLGEGIPVFQNPFPGTEARMPMGKYHFSFDKVPPPAIIFTYSNYSIVYRPCSCGVPPVESQAGVDGLEEDCKQCQ